MPSPRRAEYTAFLGELKDRIAAARLDAARAVNQELVQLYWDIGQRIVEKQATRGWGDAVVATLARDLRKAFPHTTGFSERNLWYMRRFFEAYSSPEFLRHVVTASGRQRDGLFLPQPVAEMPPAARVRSRGHLHTLEAKIRAAMAKVPWGHHRLLLDKVPDVAPRLFYLVAIPRLGWTRRVLLNQIKARAWERSAVERKTHNFNRVLPATLADQAEETLKSRYNLEFLGVGRSLRERDLEIGLIDRVREFILELGYGFCFIGRQHRLVIGQREYFVDLLFYHRFLKSLVAFELKLGPFEPEVAGKMDFYLNLLNNTERAPDDNPSIGIILCADKDDLVVEFSLKTKANPIGVAEYQLVRSLPRALHGKLPTARALRRALKEK